MIEIRRILCPIDFSESSERAVHHAVGLARWYRADIDALHVLPILPMIWGAPPTVSPETLEPIAPETFSAAMEVLLSPARESGVRTAVHLREGDAPREIVSYAGTHDIDLIVMGTHGRRGLERLVLGSVAERVLRKANCPVLTVCHARAQTAIAMSPFHRILCPVDFSPHSLRALDYALSLAQEGNADISVLYVNDPYYRRAVPDQAAGTVMDYARFLEADLRERLDRVVPRSAREWCRLREIVQTGRVWEEIVAVADDAEAELIVMGVHGRGAFDIALFGSNTHQVVRRATCPVLTIAGQPARQERKKVDAQSWEKIVI